MQVYDFTVKDQQGQPVALEHYRGKVLLIVNTATECGFTPHYEDLQALYEKYHDQGLEILDFPCHQFGRPAPGTGEEIHAFCTGRYGITFPQMEKIDVNGEQAIPLFRWLAEQTRFEGFGMSPSGIMMTQLLKKMNKDFDKDGSVKWNFTKFIIDREGNIAARFEPTHAMKKVGQKIEELL